jgi:hypothetical protein
MSDFVTAIAARGKSKGRADATDALIGIEGSKSTCYSTLPLLFVSDRSQSQPDGVSKRAEFLLTQMLVSLHEDVSSKSRLPVVRQFDVDQEVTD